MHSTSCWNSLATSRPAALVADAQAHAGVDVEVFGVALSRCATVDAASETTNGQPRLRSLTKAATGRMAAVGRVAVIRLAELADGNAAQEVVQSRTSNSFVWPDLVSPTPAARPLLPKLLTR